MLHITKRTFYRLLYLLILITYSCDSVKTADFYEAASDVSLLRGHYNRTVDYCLEGLRKYPNNHVLHFHLGKAYHAQKKYTAALKEYNEALRIAGDNPNYLQSKGILYYDQQEYNKATEIFEKILHLDKEDQEALYYLGRVYYDLGNPVRALEVYSRVLEINPKNAKAHYAVAYIYLYFVEFKNEAKAIEHLESVVKFSDNEEYRRMAMEEIRAIEDTNRSDPTADSEYSSHGVEVSMPTDKPDMENASSPTTLKPATDDRIKTSQ